MLDSDITNFNISQFTIWGPNLETTALETKLQLETMSKPLSTIYQALTLPINQKQLLCQAK